MLRLIYTLLEALPARVLEVRLALDLPSSPVQALKASGADHRHRSTFQQRRPYALRVWSELQAILKAGKVVVSWVQHLISYTRRLSFFWSSVGTTFTLAGIGWRILEMEVITGPATSRPGMFESRSRPSYPRAVSNERLGNRFRLAAQPDGPESAVSSSDADRLKASIKAFAGAWLVVNTLSASAAVAYSADGSRSARDWKPRRHHRRFDDREHGVTLGPKTKAGRRCCARCLVAKFSQSNYSRPA